MRKGELGGRKGELGGMKKKQEGGGNHTHSLTHPSTHSHTHSLTHSLTHARTHTLTHSLDLSMHAPERSARLWPLTEMARAFASVADWISATSPTGPVAVTTTEPASKLNETRVVSIPSASIETRSALSSICCSAGVPANV